VEPVTALGCEGHARPTGEYWDGVVEAWKPTVAHRLWREHSDAVNRRLLRRWLPARSGTVLKTDVFDEAVGTGLYPEIASRAQEVFGVDVSRMAVTGARERYPEFRVEVADVLALPFADGRFDVVVSNSTLDHFESHTTLWAALAELARVLRPQGKLIITVDNRSNPIVALRTSVGFEPLHRLGLVPYFVGATCGPRRLSKALRASGFTAIQQTTIMHCPPQVAARLAARTMAVPQQEMLERHVRTVLRFESMQNWPTRALTGHFAAGLAVRH
jgi:SAM-dependent methyltransferase